VVALPRSCSGCGARVATVVVALVFSSLCLQHLFVAERLWLLSQLQVQHDSLLFARSGEGPAFEKNSRPTPPLRTTCGFVG